MPDESTSRLEQVAAVLLRHGVRFIVIGGQAEWLMGSDRATFDADICYDRREDNLQNLAAALREIGVKLRNAPPDLPFQVDAKSLAFGTNFTLTTPIIDLDLLGYVEPIGGYDELLPNVETYSIGNNIELKVIALDDLIRIKEHIGRPNRTLQNSIRQSILGWHYAKKTFSCYCQPIRDRVSLLRRGFAVSC